MRYANIHPPFICWECNEEVQRLTPSDDTCFVHADGRRALRIGEPGEIVCIDPKPQEKNAD